MRGIPGAKTKRIYKSLFLAETDEFSLFAVAGARPTYCLVLAGVNDFCSRMKPSFYVHHINLISDFLQSYGIVPVVLELPILGWDVYDASLAEDGLKNDIRQLRNSLRGGSRVREDYVEALRSGVRPGTLLLPFEKVAAGFDTDRDLYRADGIHLSDKGKKKLATVFTEFIRSREK